MSVSIEMKSGVISQNLALPTFVKKGASSKELAKYQKRLHIIAGRNW